LRKKRQIFKFSEIEKKVSKKIRLEQVFYRGKNFRETTKFLRKQNFIPFKNIEKIISLQKNKNFPIGYIILNKKNFIVGFMGTWFSKRFNNNKDVFCNIHTWIVEKSYRLYSFFLLSDLYYKNINLVALTPVKSLKGLLIKMGFKKDELLLRLFLNINIFSKKNKYSIISRKQKIKNLLNKDDLNIFNSFSNEIYNKYVIYNSIDKRSIFFIGCFIRKKKIKIFNLFYISDKIKFKKDFKEIISIISKETKSIIFGEYIFKKEKSLFPEKIFFSKSFKKDIYVKSKNKFENIDLLNSDLII